MWSGISLRGGSKALFSRHNREGRCREAIAEFEGGHSVRADFKETDVVVEPLVRDREGLIREDLLRLKRKSIPYSSLTKHKNSSL